MAERSWVVAGLGKVPDQGDGVSPPMPMPIGSMVGHAWAGFFVSNEENLFNLARTVTLNGVLANTEVVVIDESDDSEITAMHVENTSVNHAVPYTFTGDVVTVEFRLHKIGYYRRIFSGVALGQTNVTIPVTQRIDRAYKNPP